MSGLRVCSKQARMPYHISEIDLNVYSLEEICYFLYNHIYLVEKSFFNDSLVSYIEHDLARPSLAQKLKQMIGAKYPVEEMVMLIFNETMYYDEHEIEKIKPILGTIEKKGVQERLQMKAESFYKVGKYEKALSIYFSILMMQMDMSLTTKFYADIYYAIGTIYGKFFVYDMAGKAFKSAFDLYPNNLYLKNMIMICLIEKDDEVLLNLIRKYNISDEILKECKDDYAILSENAKKSEELHESLESIKLEYVEMLEA
ncbi:MAG: hypothetical protein E7242_06580 [Lachnospiraceae bacterium]|nr:hypothetical protein [Lachnospiraceae bacterium]